MTYLLVWLSLWIRRYLLWIRHVTSHKSVVHMEQIACYVEHVQIAHNTCGQREQLYEQLYEQQWNLPSQEEYSWNVPSVLSLLTNELPVVLSGNFW